MKLKHSYIWSFWKKLTWPFIGVSIALLAQVILVIAQPLPAKYIIDHLIKGSADTVHNVVIKGFHLGHYTTYEGLLVLSVITLALALMQLFAEWCEVKITTDMVYDTAQRLRDDLFRKLFTRRQSYLDSKKKVDILGRMSGDISNLEIVIVFGVPAVVRAVPTIITLLATMLFLNFKFTLIFCVCLPVFYILTHYFTTKLRVTSKTLRRKTVTFEEETYESASSMAIVKSLKGEKKLLKKLLQRTDELTVATNKFRDASLWLDTSVGGTHHVVRVGLLFLGGLAILRGELTVGDLYVFMSYISSIVRPMNDITKFLSRYAKATASMDRIQEFEDELKEFPEISGAVAIEKENISKNPLLEFKKLNFNYADSKNIFQNYDLVFPSQKLIAVVGQSGVGKSSFSRLLNRLQDPVSGSVLLGGKDLREYKLEDLRSFIRILSQETFLISGTIRENLLLAASDTTNDEYLRNALRSVNALEFVDSLADGLDTEIGEGGLQISGGQAKRIHLARGFLDLDSEILVFDEPTTGLDTISSQIVMSSVQEIAKKKNLVFWITHRMQEVHSADFVLFFNQSGNPILSTHADLFESNSQYRALIEQDLKKDGSPMPAKKLGRSEFETLAEEQEITPVGVNI